MSLGGHINGSALPDAASGIDLHDVGSITKYLLIPLFAALIGSRPARAAVSQTRREREREAACAHGRAWCRVHARPAGRAPQRAALVFSAAHPPSAAPVYSQVGAPT
jgi:hypothetical protein